MTGSVTDDVSSFFRGLRERHGMDIGDEHPSPAEEVSEPETYPGSQQPLKDLSANEPDDDVEEVEWDTDPRYYMRRGVRTEFFPISALATALRRKTVTIRKWEAKGYLPHALFRTQGEGKKQDRLYTREQIAGLVEIAREENLLHPEKKLRIDQTNFPERAHRLFEETAKR